MPTIKDSALYLSHLFSVPKSEAMEIIQANGLDDAKEIYDRGVAGVELVRIGKLKGEL